MRLPVERQKKLLNTNYRDFNIVSGSYKEDNEKKVQ